MKKFYYFFLLILILGACSNSASSGGKKENTFRNTYWGMSKDEVMESTDTTMELIEDEESIHTDIPMELNSDTLWYKGTLNDENVLIEFEFYKNKLVGASYTVDYEYSSSLFSDPQYTKKYVEEIINKLNKKYGEPVIDDKSYISFYEWEDENTFVKLSSKIEEGVFLNTNNLEIWYQSQEYKKQQEEDEKNFEDEL